MPLADMKAFFRWLESASDEELKKRRAAALASVDEFSTPEIKRQVRYLIKLIEEEMLSRL